MLLVINASLLYSVRHVKCYVILRVIPSLTMLFFEKLSVVQFPVCYGTRKLVTMFIGQHHPSLS